MELSLFLFEASRRSGTTVWPGCDLFGEACPDDQIELIVRHIPDCAPGRSKICMPVGSSQCRLIEEIALPQGYGLVKVQIALDIRIIMPLSRTVGAH
jgi:hypothetical protein